MGLGWGGRRVFSVTGPGFLFWLLLDSWDPGGPSRSFGGGG